MTSPTEPDALDAESRRNLGTGTCGLCGEESPVDRLTIWIDADGEKWWIHPTCFEKVVQATYDKITEVLGVPRVLADTSTWDLAQPPETWGSETPNPTPDTKEQHSK